MGEVFLAYDERLDRTVAIKRIRPEAEMQPDRRERFRREARLAARLSHSALVPVFDILEHEGREAIVMEYVPGETLRQRLRRGPLSVRETLELARELAGGLDAAHRQGIVHRDLKTENVLIDLTGRPKITDFGIAKGLLDDGASLTAEYAVVGTCRAMSPEQARGEEVDHKTDLFAFGVLLYEMLTGSSPFAAENGLATIQRVIHHHPPPVARLVEGVPPDLSHLIERLLEKNPLSRPQSAGQVRRELDRMVLAPDDTADDETRAEQSPPRHAGPAPPAAPLPVAASIPISPPSPGAAASRLAPTPRLRRPWIWIAITITGLGAVAGYLVWRRPPPPPLSVAVLAPEVGEGAGNAEIELLAAGVRVSLLQGLIALQRISPPPLEEVDRAKGSSRQKAHALAADELLSSRLDCRAESCRFSLTRRRGADDRVLAADSLEVPIHDMAVVGNAVKSRIRHLYSGHPLHAAVTDFSPSREDLDEFLRLRDRFGSRRDMSLDALLAELEALRRRSPDYIDPYLLEADVLFRRFWASRNAEDSRRLRRLMREARKIAPYDPRPLFELVDLDLELGELDLARHHLAELAAVAPGDVGLLQRQALLLIARGESARGLAQMRQAAALRPSSQQLHALAQREMVQGETAAARQTLERLLTRVPDNVDGLSLLAQLELTSGDLGRAVALYSRLIRFSPGLSELSSLGMAHLFLGHYLEAATVFERAYRLQPGHPASALNLADARLLSGRKDEADALYRSVLELVAADPAAHTPQLLTIKAQAAAHLGQSREAVAALQEALRLAPDNNSVSFEAALVYALLGEEDSALVNAERAIRQGIGRRWFSLPWFAPLAARPEFRELLRQARPGL